MQNLPLKRDLRILRCVSLKRDNVSAVWDAPLMREGVFKNLTRRSHLIFTLGQSFCPMLSRP
ncbi:hypothetical protein TorRG33x02_295800, partial [Trema orientale]